MPTRKGNIILCLFDKYNEILKDIYENDAERCRVIINERLYFGDITEENVYFTQLLLKCYALAECEIEQDYKFNCYSGESIVKLNCNDNKLHKDDSIFYGGGLRLSSQFRGWGFSFYR